MPRTLLVWALFIQTVRWQHTHTSKPPHGARCPGLQTQPLKCGLRWGDGWMSRPLFWQSRRDWGYSPCKMCFQIFWHLVGFMWDTWGVSQNTCRHINIRCTRNINQASHKYIFFSSEKIQNRLYICFRPFWDFFFKSNECLGWQDTAGDSQKHQNSLLPILRSVIIKLVIHK